MWPRQPRRDLFPAEPLTELLTAPAVNPLKMLITSSPPLTELLHYSSETPLNVWQPLSAVPAAALYGPQCSASPLNHIIGQWLTIDNSLPTARARRRVVSIFDEPGRRRDNLEKRLWVTEKTSFNLQMAVSFNSQCSRADVWETDR